MCSAMCSVKPKQSTYVRSHRNTLVDGLGKYFLDVASMPPSPLLRSRFRHELRSANTLQQLTTIKVVFC